MVKAMCYMVDLPFSKTENAFSPGKDPFSKIENGSFKTENQTSPVGCQKLVKRNGNTTKTQQYQGVKRRKNEKGNTVHY
ncbi:MAG: hypothetical protein AB1815_06405 [Bacillota bacterium]